MLIFEIRLLLKEPLVTTFDETRALTSIKYTVIQGMSIPNSTENYKFLWSDSSVFVLE